MFRKQMLQVFVVLVVIILAGGVAFSAAPSKVIKLNPFGFILGVYNADYEMVTSNKSSLVISGLLMRYAVGSDSLTALGGGLSYRYYTRGDAPKGFYVGPSASIAFANANINAASASALVFGVGGVAGHQWISDSGFVFDLQASVSAASGGTIAPGFGLSLGYAW